MFKNKWMLLLTSCFISFASVYAQPTDMKSTDVKTDRTLHIDIPVRLENANANVVFDIDHLAKMGDMPYSMLHINILNNNFKEWNVQGQIIAIFHSDAGYVTLDDNAYNAARNVKTGNPYKAVLVNLMNQGVKIELCGATAKANNWVNADLIPGIKVNTNAMARLTQLVKEGYVKL